MKSYVTITIAATLAIWLTGCGGASAPKNPGVPEPDISGIPASEFDVVLCNKENAAKESCKEARALDPDTHNIAVLNPPKEIGVGEFVYFDGKRFGVVPKEEQQITPLKMLAYGLYQYAMEAGSDWCGPCRMLGPILDEVAREIGDKAVIAKVDVDKAQSLAVKFGVRSIPAIFILKNGEVVEQFVGVQDKQVLINAINNAL